MPLERRLTRRYIRLRLRAISRRISQVTSFKERKGLLTIEAEIIVASESQVDTLSANISAITFCLGAYLSVCSRRKGL